MAAHAGERAQEAGMFHYQKCNKSVRVNKGAIIPKCRKCGGSAHDKRTEESNRTLKRRTDPPPHDSLIT